MGRLFSVAVNDHAAHCFDGEEEEQMPCCEDVTDELRIEQITTVSNQIELESSYISLTFKVLLPYNLKLYEQNEFGPGIPEPPPLPNKNLQKIHQVFLI